MIGWMAPLVIRVWEKSPIFSSAVGMLARLVCVGRASSVYSCEAKKNTFFLLPPLSRLSMMPGITTGPPTV